MPDHYYRIDSFPQRFWSRPPSAIAMTTRTSFGRGASATDTVIVSKCAKDQESSLRPSGTSRLAPAAATFPFEEITALPPPFADYFCRTRGRRGALVSGQHIIATRN
jgi:hypothetical protein